MPEIVAANAVGVEDDHAAEPLLIVDPGRFSSLGRMLRVLAYALRFLENLKHARSTGNRQARSIVPVNEMEKKIVKEFPCSFEEKNRALLFVVNQEQQDLLGQIPLPRKSSLSSLNLEVEDRVLSGSSVKIVVSRGRTGRKLIVLPKSSPLSKLLMLDAHLKVYHSGANATLAESRRLYWIIGARQLSKSVVRSCGACRIFSRSRVYSVQESKLPDFRVEVCRPFSRIGIDYCGPIHCKDHDKAYILLVTCAVTRALHLELVEDMSYKNLVHAFRRFLGRRGFPEIVVSDNGRSFKKMGLYFGKNLSWRFLPDRSPWWGGFYERCVGLVKHCLRRSVGKSLLSFRSLEALVVGIEFSLNNRPLTAVAGSPNDAEPLTPNHFIMPSAVSNQSSIETSPPAVQWKHHSVLLSHFWKRWSAEYVSELQTWHTTSNTSTVVPKVGDVVLVGMDGHKRQRWPLGKITKLIFGRDGLVRAVFVLVHGCELRRPLQKLVPLETDSSYQASSDDTPDVLDVSALDPAADAGTTVAPVLDPGQAVPAPAVDSSPGASRASNDRPPRLQRTRTRVVRLPSRYLD